MNRDGYPPKPIRSVEHAANSLRKRGYIVKYHERFDPLLQVMGKGYVIVPNDGALYDFNSMPIYFGLQLIEIAEQKRLEEYQPKREYGRKEPDHYDLIESLVRTNIEQNKILAELREELTDLKDRLFG